ncbi:unnamed protein product [Sphagnum tenellum]
MPENYLHLSGDVVDALGRTENNQPLQFNEIQCRLLKQKLQETVTPLLSRVDKDSLTPEKQALFEQRCRGAALLELYRIVKRAEAIIHGCSIQDWLTEAIKLASSFETFVDIFFKLDWCKAVVGIVFSNALESELQHVGDNIDGFGEAECAFKMEEIRNILRQPASQDLESLRRRLTEMQEDTGARSKQDSYLLNLLTTDPVHTEETTFHVLPSIKREHLRHLRRIGKGGFGTVAEVEWLGQKVAQKMFKGVDSRSFRFEANILAGLRHPNIVQIFGVTDRDCAGPSQTFAIPRFTMAPEDVDREIETDDRVHNMNTLFNRLDDLQQQVQERDQTVREQTEMLRERDETLRGQDQTIQMLLARQERFKWWKCVVQ